MHFREAVKLNPDYWQAHFNVGTSCLQEGRLSEARAEFDIVLRLQPDFRPAKSALAAIEARQSGGATSKP
jgi:Flp pilus assembly protein TadD